MVSILLAFFMGAPSAIGEYRAYELQIISSASGEVQQKVSYLDPLQYRTYFKSQISDQVKLIDTWKCPDRTNHLEQVCAKPIRNFPE